MEEGAVLPLSVPCLIFQGLHSSSCVNTIEELRYCLMGEDCDLGEAQHGWAGARHSSTHSTPLHTLRGRGRLTQLLESEVKMGQLALIFLFYSFLSVAVKN